MSNHHHQSMRISFTPDQTSQLLAWAHKGARAEVDVDCEPSGYVLQIEIGSIELNAVAVRGNERLDLGEVDVDLIEDR